MSKPNPKVDWFFAKNGKWQAEFDELRQIALDTELHEDLKWGCPCYTLENKNVFLIHGFKDYCALLFMKGVLMKDPKGILIQQTENVQSARQIRFTSLEEIVELKKVLKNYMLDAIKIEKSGVQVEMTQSKSLELSEEFQSKLEENLQLKKAFEALTPGRQRAYHLHFTSAKQASTRLSRIEKCIPDILKGKGLND